MHGWRTNARDRAILSAYRGRNRTLWSKEEQELRGSKFGKATTDKRMFFHDDDNNDEGTDWTNFQLNTRDELRIMKNVSFRDDKTNTLKGTAEGFYKEDGSTETSLQKEDG